MLEVGRGIVRLLVILIKLTPDIRGQVAQVIYLAVFFFPLVRFFSLLTDYSIEWIKLENTLLILLRQPILQLFELDLYLNL